MIVWIKIILHNAQLQLPKANDNIFCFVLKSEHLSFTFIVLQELSSPIN